MMTLTLEEALVLMKQAQAKADERIGRIPGDRHNRDWWKQYRAIMADCQTELVDELGTRVNDRWDGCSIALAGVRATSTHGLKCAIGNWIAAAERRLR